jgi:integrase
LKSHIGFIISHTPKDLAFDKLTVAHVEKILLARKEQSAPATAKHTLNCLRAAHTYVKRLGYTVQDIEWPSVTIRNQRQRYLTPEEEQRFLDELSPKRTWSKMASDLTDYQKEGLQQNHDIGIALLDTGDRLNEVLKLQWKDVDVAGKTIVLWRTKTRNGTTLMMTERLYQVMKRRFDNKRDATWVFPGINGPALSFDARIRKAIKRAGLKDFRLHDIRHSFASKLVQQGCTLYEVAALLGHISPNTSARYSHLEKKSVAEKAANVLNALNTK